MGGFIEKKLKQNSDKQNSEKKFGESETFHRSKFSPATGVSLERFIWQIFLSPSRENGGSTKSIWQFLMNFNF